MKRALMVLASLALVNTVAFADRGGRGGGGGDNDAGDLMRGTAAWFAHEASEESLRLLIASDASAANDVTGVNVAQEDATTYSVEIDRGEESVNFTCRVVTDTSRGGSVTRQDLNCLAL